MVLSQDIEYSSLWSTVGPCLFIDVQIISLCSINFYFCATLPRDTGHLKHPRLCPSVLQLGILTNPQGREAILLGFLLVAF